MPDRTIAPPFVKSSSFNLITPRHTPLPNGINLYCLSGSAQQVVKIELVFPAGRWFEEKPAAAYFMAHMLSKGTKSTSSFEIASIFDQYGAHLEISPGLDFVSISLYALTNKLVPVLDLLIEVLSAPAFPEKEFRQLQTTFLQNLTINNEKTSFVASQTFRKNLYGEQHPYGLEVTEPDVNALDTGTLEKHYTAHAHSPVVFASGNIDAANQDVLAAALSRLPVRNHEPAPSHTINAQPAHQHLDRKDSVQSSVRMGRRSLLRSDPDYVPLLFATHILGGYFGSRLMKNIREDKGLTYGISASIHGLKNDSFLVIGADVNKENVALTFDEIQKELRILRTTPISADELETSRNQFIGGLQAEITTPFAHAEKIKAITLYNLRNDHYREMIRKINDMTASDIMAISERYLHEDAFVRIAVG